MIPAPDVTNDPQVALYERHFYQLTSIAITKFSLPREVAEEIVYEVLLASLRHSPNCSNISEVLTDSLLYAIQHRQPEDGA